MRIAYIAFIDARHVGVQKKIANQTMIWQQSNAQVVTYFDTNRFGAIGKLFGRYFTLLVVCVIKRRQFDIIYLRQTQVLPGFKTLLNRSNYVLEVNADPTVENSSLTRMKRWMRSFLSNDLHVKASATFFVSNELKNRYLTECQGQCFVFPNALEHPPKIRKLPRGKNVVFVGTGAFPWLGIDIALQLASALPDFNFHIVGDIVIEKLPPNVSCKGVLTGSVFNDFLLEMDFGLSTLAFSRSGLTEGSALKTRSYISANLPIISGYVDSDFNDEPFYFNLQGLGIKEITRLRHFLLRWKHEPIEVRDEGVLFSNREALRITKLEEILLEIK